MRHISLFLFASAIVFLGACSNVEKVQHVEVYALETLEENSEGYFEQNGYKKVNAITSTELYKDSVKNDMKAVEDFYDLEGNYLKTEIIHLTFEKSYVTAEEDSEERKTEIQEPSTLLIPDEEMDDFQTEPLSGEEEEKVKKRVLSLMNRL